nr:DUF1573 domain-containing protein [Bacteroidota bacterium]
MRSKIFFLYLFLFSILFTACNLWSSDGDKLPADLVKNPKTASGREDASHAPAVIFDTDYHDFGRVIQGEKVTYAYKFQNTGNADLIITNVSSSCGCTVPDFTREPVKPGAHGVIKVTFDSDNRRGFQNKTVTVLTNTIPNTKVLKMKAQVVVPEKDN